MNLTETIRQHFGYPELVKIDPQTEETKGDTEYPLGQAAIPAILTGLYKYTNNDFGAEQVLSSDISTNWVREFFPGYNYEVVDRIAAYSGKNKETTQHELNEIAKKAVEEIRKAVAPKNDLLDVKKFMADQRANIFPYLPIQIRLGELIQDTTLDDKTTKMEGPVSNLIKSVGELFSAPDNDEKLTNEI